MVKPGPGDQLMKNLIIIGSVWPEPNSSAAGTRMVQLIRLFQEMAWKVTFASAATLSGHRADLTGMGVAEVGIRLNCSSFDVWLTGQQPDAVVFDRFITEEQFGWRVAKNCPEALRILDTEDLHSLRAARLQRLKYMKNQHSNEMKRQSVGPVLASHEVLFQTMAAGDLALREVASIYRSDLSLMISEFEMALLQVQFGIPFALLHYLPLFAERDDHDGLPFRERANFVSIGNFRHPPNQDACLWLKHQLWPQIRARLPGAELHLYGAYPTPKASALNNPEQGFLVKGWAADAHVVLGQARVCLAPLRFGAGIKGKLLDAMACQTPSVTTSIGAEGMHGSLPWPGCVADDMPAFVRAAEVLYSDEKQWGVARQRCRPVLTERFAPALFTDGFGQRIERTIGQLDDLRRSNFIGAMLNHHQHRSTQYMSQWIEAKSRPPGSL
jgi:glycosyltransferase involved in cell wall biosynthesis